MSSGRNRTTRLPAPYLRRIWLEPSRVADRKAYPFCLPFLRDDFELSFDRSITIILGENGAGKSTVLEGIAALAGYDEAGGGKGYRAVDHSMAIEEMGGELATALRASWLTKITKGWFFRAESFFSVARYLDQVGSRSADFLSHSHGEGFLRFLRRALPGPRHLRLRRAGIGVVAVASDRIPEIDAADGYVSELPGDHGDTFACPDGLSQCASAEVIKVWIGARDRRTDGSLQDHARILQRSGGIRGSDDRLIIARRLPHACAGDGNAEVIIAGGRDIH
jgi:hypothetical protein